MIPKWDWLVTRFRRDSLLRPEVGRVEDVSLCPILPDGYAALVGGERADKSRFLFALDLPVKFRHMDAQSQFDEFTRVVREWASEFSTAEMMKIEPSDWGFAA